MKRPAFFLLACALSAANFSPARAAVQGNAVPATLLRHSTASYANKRLSNEFFIPYKDTDCKYPPFAACDDPVRKIRNKIITPLMTPLDETVNEGLADKIFSKIVIPLGKGPLLLLPIIDSSKDLGPNYGVMPIFAIRDEKRQAIGSVIAPSINYNQYLKTTLAYRHYFFPDDQQLWLIRAMYSQEVQREIFLRYFNPHFLDTDFRMNAEIRHWINGKASFYGYGPDTSLDDQATFALAQTGEEFTISIPLIKNVYVDFTQSFYRYRVADGPVLTIPQLKNLYPADYAMSSSYKAFSTGKLSLFYDGTDHPVIPKLGTYAGISAMASKKAIGSDYTYMYYTVNLKHYYNWNGSDKRITALNMRLEQMTGDQVPFYAMPVLGEGTGLRSVGDGRYVDRGKLVFNIEQRFTLTRIPILKFFSEIEVTPFIDMGTVYRRISFLQTQSMKFAYGGAFRIVLRPQVVATADVAFGHEGTNLIIKVGYPF